MPAWRRERSTIFRITDESSTMRARILFMRQCSFCPGRSAATASTSWYIGMGGMDFRKNGGMFEAKWSPFSAVSRGRRRVGRLCELTLLDGICLGGSDGIKKTEKLLDASYLEGLPNPVAHPRQRQALAAVLASY